MSVEATKQERELGFQGEGKGMYWKVFRGMGVVKTCFTVFLLFFGGVYRSHSYAESASSECGELWGTGVTMGVFKSLQVDWGS